MLLSTSYKRLETCTLVSRYYLLQKYIGKELMRIISTSGISHPGIKEGDENDFDTIAFDFNAPNGFIISEAILHQLNYEHLQDDSILFRLSHHMNEQFPISSL